ncbi:DNA topoisomerase 2-binding protein 1-B [Nilaparvata lugens]|uniref:DNA topoisomerase 2-binding protein 1-B n=1 Tax=Nilaparvata lugens TaxID=108931 RepID=UPI00193C974D|nr:DNA topoisomerase 2-binding protein 1-B [Nilaparvata lugens]
MLSVKDMSIHFLVTSENDKDISDEMKKTFQDCKEAGLKPKFVTEAAVKELLREEKTNKSIIVEKFEGHLFEYLKRQKCYVCGPKCLQICLAEKKPLPQNKSPVFITAMRDLVVSASNIPPQIKVVPVAVKALKPGSSTEDKLDFFSEAETMKRFDHKNIVKLLGVCMKEAPLYTIMEFMLYGQCHIIQKAIEKGIPIMTVEWVDAVWNEGIRRNVHATNSQFNKYKCPVFLDLFVTVSNMPQSDKEKIKRLINSNGGTYSKEMKKNETSVLIISNVKNSQKFTFAQEWKLPCVSPLWVYESVEKGYALPVDDYVMKPTVHSSTPTKDDQLERMSFGAADISAVAGTSLSYQSGSLPSCNDTTLLFNKAAALKSAAKSKSSAQHSYKTDLDKLNLTDAKRAGAFLEGCKVYLSGFGAADISAVAGMSLSYQSGSHPSCNDTTLLFNKAAALKSAAKSKSSAQHSYKTDLDKLNLTDAKRAGAFLEGCKVYLSGFKSAEQDKLKRILTLAGAVVFMEISDAVSHVICGEFVAADMKAVNKSANRPFLVTVEWLVVSVAQKSTAPEEIYCKLVSEVSADPEPPSPLSQKGMKLLKRSETLSPDQTKVAAKEKSPEDVESKEANHSVVNRKLFGDCDNDEPSEDKNDKQQDDVIEIKDDMENGEEASVTEGPIFKGLAFLILDFEDTTEELIRNMINENGGKVVSQIYKGVTDQFTDYAIVPFEGASGQLQLQSTVVTHIWLEDCVQENKLLPVVYYHEPISILNSCAPLTGCVITISTYTNKERIFLDALVEALGAISQEVFARKDNVAKGVKACTHLVTPSAGSQKYMAALKWNIPTVTKDWLLSCARLGKRLPEIQFSVAAQDGNQVCQPPTAPRAPASNDASNDCQVKDTPRPRDDKRISLLVPTKVTDLSQQKTIFAPVNEETPKRCTRTGNETRVPTNEDEKCETPVASTSFQRSSSHRSVSNKGDGGTDAPPSTGYQNRTPVASTSFQRSSSHRSTTNQGDGETEAPPSTGYQNRTPVASTSFQRSSSHRSVSNQVDGETEAPPSTGYQCGTPINLDNRTRKSLGLTPAYKLPWEMSTPDTPYEKLLPHSGGGKEARKRIKHCIDNFSQNVPKIPSPRKRKMSTPLSELMKRAKAKFGLTPDTSMVDSNNVTGSEDIENCADVKNEKSFKESTTGPKNTDHCNDNTDNGIETEQSSTSTKTPAKTSAGSEFLDVLNEKLQNLTPACQEVKRWIPDTNDQVVSARKSTESKRASTKSMCKLGLRVATNRCWLAGTCGRKGESKVESEIAITAACVRAECRGERTTDCLTLSIFSGVLMNEKKGRYEEVIVGLGGTLIKTDIYSSEITHLITDGPKRSEKLLCSIAAGHYILHTSYLDESSKSGYFLPEEQFEWGNELAKENLPNLPAENERLLAEAAYKWRLRVCNSKTKTGAYDKMKAVIFTTSNKMYENLFRLINAGNGEVLGRKEDLNATHCFIDPKYNSKINVELLASKNIYCLNSVNLVDILVNMQLDYEAIIPKDYIKYYKF